MIARDAVQSGDSFDVRNAYDRPVQEAGVCVYVCSIFVFLYVCM